MAFYVNLKVDSSNLKHVEHIFLQITLPHKDLRASNARFQTDYLKILTNFRKISHLSFVSISVQKLYRKVISQFDMQVLRLEQNRFSIFQLQNNDKYRVIDFQGERQYFTFLISSFQATGRIFGRYQR